MNATTKKPNRARVEITAVSMCLQHKWKIKFERKYNHQMLRTHIGAVGLNRDFG